LSPESECIADVVGGSVAALHRCTGGGGERSGEFFGEEALGTLLEQTGGCAHRCCGPEYFYCAAVGASQDDDLTVLACDYIGVG
jgi:hypothetical protein